MKKLIIGILIGMMIATSTVVLAENRTIEAAYNNIKILIDGKEIKTDTEPFIAQERTFVPVRFVAENLGAEVDYKNNTVIIKNLTKEYATQMFNYTDLADFWNWSNILFIDFSVVSDGINNKDLSYLKTMESHLKTVQDQYNSLVKTYTQDEYKGILKDYSEGIVYFNKAYSALLNYGNGGDYNTTMNYFNDYQSMQEKGINSFQSAYSKSKEQYFNYYSKTQK
jgi:hypothetical protein